MVTTNAPGLEPSGNDSCIESNHTDGVSTCPHGRAFCPVENPDARSDAFECFDCFVEA
jgi:hypothetical protein